ncbi:MULTISPECIES: phage major capsid protein [Lactobacillus]|uniref:Phage major capsid protein n=1 Tax=Lactobacillus taiwanensis TaxID=508451 RepID=A0A256L9H6_9LACO|nr:MULTISPECIES: phage major capsid protein [Lactobacillus]OYR86843.1 phage major capsid protein [Lactobacillus taiwanensis]OYR89920.1 phage major capsid protein [Lactobacillus taiwanensis]OYR93307.1 phage major capsid protein [Lactobacillus taiwanensis]OYR93825.1 phage major capsid protein [Lactobacillus taiwanensis]
MNIFELRQETYNAGQALKDIEDALAKAATDPDPKALDDIKALSQKKEGAQLRYNTLKERYEQAKQNQADEIKNKLEDAKKNETKMPEDPKERLIKAEAAWIRKTVRPDNANFQEKWNSVKQELKDDDASKGGNLLPVNVSNQLISEPFATNPLRQMETISTVTNLILPRIAFDVADDDFIKDGEIAKEMDLKTDKVTFGRNEMKVRAGISDTVLLGSDAGLVEYVNNALSSALQLKERKLQLGTSNPAGLEHMSFYDTTTVKIKSVSGKDLFHAIRKAIADLDDAFQDNAQVLMTRSDYYDMLDSLANNSATLYQAQPESVLGVPVKFTSAATTPVVGDFSFAQLNYEINSSLYEQYKDYQKGMNYFQLTAWFDHQIKLASAFRLAKVDGAGK